MTKEKTGAGAASRGAPSKSLRQATSALDRLEPAEAAALLGELQREAGDRSVRQAAAALRLHHLKRGLTKLRKAPKAAAEKPPAPAPSKPESSAATTPAPAPEPPSAPAAEPEISVMDVEDPALKQLFSAMESPEEEAAG